MRNTILRKKMQVTDTLLMVRPNRFYMNSETAVNNYFQKNTHVGKDKINASAQREFDGFVSVLRERNIQVIVVEDTSEQNTPDSIFPNNWVSFHENGTVALYPMYAENRRVERKLDIWKSLKDADFQIDDIKDYSQAENTGQFLEGTGSMVLDRENKRAYCALSDRADRELFEKFCHDFGYMPVSFVANQTVGKKRMPIYHTNVMMCIATTFAIICLESIDDREEREHVVDQLRKTGKHIIPISEEQVGHFAGNMLQVKNTLDYEYLVMSSTAARSLSPRQIINIQKHCDIIHSELGTIETCGGGSARCMMAEIFLQKK
ncbi:citrulline utilization hydrolase CtlX [Maribacter sp. 2210JD10-5]|uniref:citrulline utilization hydrolase CtlX n=1 Tax=Maribacter sp. 2210JD10-5 TaxID=3386272 RepID=UPI0039BC2C5D